MKGLPVSMRGASCCHNFYRWFVLHRPRLILLLVFLVALLLLALLLSYPHGSWGPPSPFYSLKETRFHAGMEEGRHNYTIYHYVCEALLALEPPEVILAPTTNPYRDRNTTEELKKVFERFHAVPDHRDGEPARRTAEVRFVTPVHSLDYQYLQLFLLSAHIAGTPYELLGLDSSELHLNPMTKFLLLEAYLDETGLTDSDVIVMTDADVVFTGRDFMPMIRSFLSTTPRSPSEMDAKKIRGRQLRAPILLGTEERCSMPSVVLDSTCTAIAELLEEQRERWVAAHNSQKAFSSSATSSAANATPQFPWRMERNDHRKRSTHVHPNSGSVVARVWALRILLRRLKHFASTRLVMNPWWASQGQKWWCDQSIVGSLLYESARWELESGAVPLQPEPGTSSEGQAWQQACAYWSPHQLPPGLIDLDYAQDVLVSLNLLEHLYSQDRLMNLDTLEEISRLSYAKTMAATTHPVQSATDGEVVVRFLPHENLTLQRSPTGVPLAPLNVTADLRSNENQYYQNWTLDGSEGTIDLSVPHPSGVPLGLHYNGGAKAHILDFSFLLPWMALLYAEGPRLAHVDAAEQPQLSALLRLVSNAPGTRVWRSDYNGTRIDFAAPLNRTRGREERVMFREVCAWHRSNLMYAVHG